jgi:ionotropic glutamate receptor
MRYLFLCLFGGGNYSLMELWETGLPQYWVKNSMPRAPKCFEKTKLRRTANPKPIRLDDLAGAFFILGVGVGLATFFFLVENMIRFISLATSTATKNNRI